MMMVNQNICIQMKQDLKNYTYRSSVFCNIGIKYIFNGTFIVNNYERLNIGFIPYYDSF